MSFILATSSAFASDDVAEQCEIMGSFSEIVMTQRQDGEALSELMGKLNAYAESNAADPAFIKEARGIIIGAYKKSRYSTDEFKLKAIQDFRNDVELMCWTTYS